MADLISTDQVNPQGAALGDTLVRDVSGVFVPAAPSSVSMRPAWTNASGAPPVPAAGDQGRFWRQSDTGRWYVADHDGVAWGFRLCAISGGAYTPDSGLYDITALLRVNQTYRIWWQAGMGAATDYTTLPQWGYSVAVTGEMGQVPATPRFYVMRQAQVAGLEWNNNGLVYELPAASLIAPQDGWPGGNDAGEVVIPITMATDRHLTITARIRTNIPAQAAPGAGELSTARLVLSRAIVADPNDPPDAACLFEFTRNPAVNGGNITESTAADGEAGYSADLNAEVVAGEIVRDVMFEIHGAMVNVSTGPSGGPVVQRSSVFNHAENIVTTAFILSLNGFHNDWGATPVGSWVRLESLVIDQLD